MEASPSLSPILTDEPVRLAEAGPVWAATAKATLLKRQSRARGGGASALSDRHPEVLAGASGLRGWWSTRWKDELIFF